MKNITWESRQHIPLHKAPSLKSPQITFATHSSPYNSNAGGPVPRPPLENWYFDLDELGILSEPQISQLQNGAENPSLTYS